MVNRQLGISSPAMSWAWRIVAGILAPLGVLAIFIFTVWPLPPKPVQFMTVLTRSSLLMVPANVAFGVVNDVESYPEFLPGCNNVELLATDGQNNGQDNEAQVRGPCHRGCKGYDL